MKLDHVFEASLVIAVAIVSITAATILLGVFS